MVAGLLVALASSPPAIVSGNDAVSLFPAAWRASPYDLRVTALSASDAATSRRAISAALSRYGSSIALPQIALVSSFSLGGREYGGTYFDHTVFIACEAADDKFMRRALHHEFSSILLMKNQINWNKEGWLDSNPTGFLYGSGGFNSLSHGMNSTEIDRSAAAEGFVSDYGKASLEEDFNLVAENLFEGGPEFWRIVDDSPRLLAKVKIALAFYEALDPALTESSFRNHSQY